MFVCLCVVRASAAVFFCAPARPRSASSPDVYNAYGENMVNVKDSQCLQRELVRPIDALHLLCRPRPTALGLLVWVAFQGPLAECAPQL